MPGDGAVSWAAAVPGARQRGDDGCVHVAAWFVCTWRCEPRLRFVFAWHVVDVVDVLVPAWFVFLSLACVLFNFLLVFAPHSLCSQPRPLLFPLLLPPLFLFLPFCAA